MRLKRSRRTAPGKATPSLRRDPPFQAPRGNLPRECFALCLALLVGVALISMPRASAEFRPPDSADSLPPTGEILYPLPGGWSAYPYVSIGVRFLDPDGIMVSSLSVAVDGVPIVTSWNGIIVNAYIQGLAEGPHTAEARASDQLGNGPTVLSWPFSLDTTRPVINITSPSGNPELTDGSVTLRWTGTDLPSGIDRYQVRLDSGPSIDVGTATSFPFPELAPGIHYFMVTGYDLAGNSAATTSIATVPAPAAQDPGNTTVVVSLSGDMPGWALALIVISIAELAAIIGLILQRRRDSREYSPRNG